jgi:2-keto-4-pentenoate hydratase
MSVTPNVWDDPRVRPGMQKQLDWRRSRLQEGETSVGWKVAFSAPAALEQLKISAPLVGFFTDSALLADGAEVSIRGWTKPALEPEIAIHMGQDLAAGADRETAVGGIRALGAAFEIADLDLPLDQVEEFVAQDLFQRHVILGPADEAFAGGAAGELRASIKRSTEPEPIRNDAPEEFVGNLVDVTRHVADYLGAFGINLSAGDVIIAGSVVPLVWVEPGERVDFELEPLGKLSVSFAG